MFLTHPHFELNRQDAMEKMSQDTKTTTSFASKAIVVHMTLTPEELTDRNLLVLELGRRRCARNATGALLYMTTTKTTPIGGLAPKSTAEEIKARKSHML